MNLSISRINNTHFLTIAKIGFHTAGIAEFWKEASVWRARVDVKEKYREHGIGTSLLHYGDNYIHENYPEDLREFRNLNPNYPYRKYTDSIPNSHIISYDEDRVVFRP